MNFISFRERIVFPVDSIFVAASSFVNCREENGDGGAIIANVFRIHIISSLFEECSSTRHGGALYLTGSAISIDDLKFRLCRSADRSQNKGGNAMFLSPDVLISDFISIYKCADSRSDCGDASFVIFGGQNSISNHNNTKSTSSYGECALTFGLTHNSLMKFLTIVENTDYCMYQFGLAKSANVYRSNFISNFLDNAFFIDSGTSSTIITECIFLNNTDKPSSIKDVTYEDCLGDVDWAITKSSQTHDLTCVSDERNLRFHCFCSKPIKNTIKVFLSITIFVNKILTYPCIVNGALHFFCIFNETFNNVCIIIVRYIYKLIT